MISLEISYLNTPDFKKENLYFQKFANMSDFAYLSYRKVIQGAGVEVSGVIPKMNKAMGSVLSTIKTKK